MTSCVTFIIYEWRRQEAMEGSEGWTELIEGQRCMQSFARVC